MPKDATCAATAVRGPWLKLADGGWLLTSHPRHGTLVTREKS
jgi:hypothetical protein